MKLFKKLKNLFKLLLISIRKLNSPTLTKPLLWSVIDFENGKKWAQCRLYPGEKYRSIWDVVYSPRFDSTEVLHEINKFIIKENKNNQK